MSDKTDWGAIASSGLNVISSIFGSKSAKTAAKAEAANLQYQMNILKQKEQSTLKYILIGGGVFVVSIVAIFLVRR